MEFGAILIYLADKTGKPPPTSGEEPLSRHRVADGAVGGLGPMLGQAHHFVKYNKGKAPYAEERYRTEGHRLYNVLNPAAGRPRVRHRRTSIADVAIWPWISRFEWQESIWTIIPT